MWKQVRHGKRRAYGGTLIELCQLASKILVPSISAVMQFFTSSFHKLSCILLLDAVSKPDTTVNLCTDHFRTRFRLRTYHTHTHITCTCHTHVCTYTYHTYATLPPPHTHTGRWYSGNHSGRSSLPPRHNQDTPPEQQGVLGGGRLPQNLCRNSPCSSRLCPHR